MESSSSASISDWVRVLVWRGVCEVAMAGSWMDAEAEGDGEDQIFVQIVV